MCLLHQQAPCSAILVVSPFSYNPTYQVIKYYLKKCQLSYLLQYPHIHPALLERCCKDHLFILVSWRDQVLFISLGRRNSLLHWSAYCLFPEGRPVWKLVFSKADQSWTQSFISVSKNGSGSSSSNISNTYPEYMCFFPGLLSYSEREMKEEFFQRFLLCGKMA